MPQTSAGTYRERIGRLQAAMKESGLGAVVLEPGPAMLYLTGVWWGKSERTFAVVLPAKGQPVWVVPGFEESRAREMIPRGDEVRVWQEDESPFERIAAALADREARTRVAMDEDARFFVFDGVRKLSPKLDYVGADAVLRLAGVGLAATGGRGGRK